MSVPPPFPDGWFGRDYYSPAKLKLVKGPDAQPRAAEPFPFWLAVLIATAVLAIAAVGARFWILPTWFVVHEGEAVPVLDIRHAEASEKKQRFAPVVPRLDQLQPVAPRRTAPVAIPAVQPELVAAEWDPPASEPYDPTEDLEEADLPFPVKAEPEPEVAKTTPKRSKPSSTRRAEERPRSTPKPKSRPKPKPVPVAVAVARGPSRPVRELKRYQPPYPRSARRAGDEGRVVLTVQVRPDGRIGSVRLSSSSGSPVLDSAAISAVKRWKFAPELKNGKPVTATVRVPFTFALR